MNLEIGIEPDQVGILKCPFVPNTVDYNHIESIEVFTGPDDYFFSSSLEIKSINHELVTTKKTITQDAPVRVRGEIAVKFNFQSEYGEAPWSLLVGHHKGQIVCLAEKRGNAAQ